MRFLILKSYNFIFIERNAVKALTHQQTNLCQVLSLFLFQKLYQTVMVFSCVFKTKF